MWPRQRERDSDISPETRKGKLDSFLPSIIFFLKSGKWHPRKTRGRKGWGIIINKISSVAKLLIPRLGSGGGLKPVPKGAANFPRKSARFRVITGFSWWLRPWKAVSTPPFTPPPLPFSRIIPHGFKEMNSRATRTRRFLKQITAPLHCILSR